MAARSSSLRQGRYSAAGQVYLITAVTHARAPLFADFWTARACISELRYSDRVGRCTTFAYVLMPDHLHWMVQLLERQLPDLLRNFKASSSRVVNEMHEAAGRQCWQSGYHDHAIRDDQDLSAAARYLVANPLRAGLVKHLADYPHWDAKWL